MRDHGEVPDTYADDWCRAQHALAALTKDLNIQHIAAHRESIVNYQSLDEWTAYWNGRADHEAMLAHGHRPPRLRQIWDQLCRWHDSSLAQLCKLQSLHLAILRGRRELQDELRDLHQDAEAELEPLHDTLTERRAVAGWQHLLAAPDWGDPVFLNLVDQFGAPFCRKMVDWIYQQSQSDSAVEITISHLHLAFFWGVNFAGDLPRPHPTRRSTWTTSVACVGESLTVAAVLRLIRNFFAALKVCPAQCRQISLIHCGVYTPLTGVVLAVDRHIVRSIELLVSDFTVRRPIRRANDLARPFH